MRHASIGYLVLLALFSFVSESHAQPDFRMCVYELESHAPKLAEGLPTAFSVYLRGALAKDKRLAVLEREEMARLYRDRFGAQKMPQVYDAKTAVELGKMLECNYAVFGDFRNIDDETILHARVVSIKTSAFVASFEEPMAAAKVLDLATATAGKLIDQLFPGAPTGVLRIAVTPADARLRISGEAVERQAPLDIRQPAGKYTIDVIPADPTYTPQVLIIEVIAGRTTERTVTLTKKKSELQVAPWISEALIYVDSTFIGAVTGSQRLAIDAGDHHVTILTRHGSRFSASKHFAENKTEQVPWLAATSELHEGGRSRLLAETNRARQVLDAATVPGHTLLNLDNGVVIGLARTSFVERWRYGGDETLHGVTAVGSRTVAVGNRLETTTSMAGSSTLKLTSVVVIDGATGQTAWRSGERSQPVVCRQNDQRHAVFVFAGGRVVVVPAAPSKPFEMTLSIPSQAAETIDWSECRVSGSKIFFFDKERRNVRAFGLAEDGREVWQRQLEEGIEGIRQCGQTLGLYLAGGAIVGLEPASGIRKWRAPLAARADYLRCHDSRFIAVSHDGGYAETDAGTGETRERRFEWVRPSVVTACEIDAVGRVVLALSGYRVIVYDPTLGVPIWSHELRDAVKRMEFADGHVVVISERGRVYEFASDRLEPADGWVDKIERTSGLAVLWDQNRDQLRAERIACVRQVPESGARHIVGRGTIGPGREGRLRSMTCGNSQSGPKAGDLLVQPGTLVLHGVGSETAVFVDDAFVGKGTRVIAALEIGAHTISLHEAGKEPFRETVHVNADADTELQVALRPPSERVLWVRTRPAGAEVYLNGDLQGRSPVALYELNDGQTVRILIKKAGYASQEEAVLIDGNDITREYRLSYPRSSAGVFFSRAVSKIPYIMAWPSSGLTPAGPEGIPVAAEPKTFVTARGEAGLGRVAVYGEYTVGFKLIEGLIGAGYYVSRAATLGDIRVGVGFRPQSPGFDSSPPSAGYGAESSDLPLEYWTHPVGGVYADNGYRSYVGPTLKWQPLEGVTVNAEWGVLNSGGTLTGGPLYEDSRFHLVVDPTRSYSLAADRGRYFQADVMARLRAERFFPGDVARALAVRIVYRRARVDYLAASERGSLLTLGVGFMFSPLP
jgi:hypothetical protein